MEMRGASLHGQSPRNGVTPASPSHESCSTGVSRFRKDYATRQRLLKHCSAFGSGLCVVEVEPYEGGQSFEMLQTGIGDLCVAEEKMTEAC